MQRTQRTNKKKRTRRPRQNPAQFAVPSLRSLSPTRRIVACNYRNLLAFNNVGAVGASIAVPLFLLTGLTPAATGLTPFWTAGSGSGTGQYLNARLLEARAIVGFTNAEAFVVRVSTVFLNDTLATNAQISAASQNAYLNNTANIVRSEVIGPLTGQGRIDLRSRASLKRTFGISPMRGLVDVTTNSLNATTTGLVPATVGINLALFLHSPTANLVNGVVANIEVELIVEVFTPNPART